MDKHELITRYHAARLTNYRRTLGDEGMAQVAAQFAVANALSDLAQYTRRGAESEGLEVLAMDVEDLEAYVAKFAA